MKARTITVNPRSRTLWTWAPLPNQMGGPCSTPSNIRWGEWPIHDTREEALEAAREWDSDQCGFEVFEITIALPGTKYQYVLQEIPQ
jgi:hypothetical protein